jgi:thioredoxin reductase
MLPDAFSCLKLFVMNNPGYQARFVIASSGAVDIQPRLKHLSRYFGKGYYTCVDCDGHLTTGKKLLVMGNNLNAARLALAMQQMYSDRVTAC